MPEFIIFCDDFGEGDIAAVDSYWSLLLALPG